MPPLLPCQRPARDPWARVNVVLCSALVLLVLLLMHQVSAQTGALRGIELRLDNHIADHHESAKESPIWSTAGEAPGL